MKKSYGESAKHAGSIHFNNESYVKLFWALAQRSVVLLDEVPSNLILGNVLRLIWSGFGDNCISKTCSFSVVVTFGDMDMASAIYAIDGESSGFSCHVCGLIVEDDSGVRIRRLWKV